MPCLMYIQEESSYLVTTDDEKTYFTKSYEVEMVTNMEQPKCLVGFLCLDVVYRN